MAPQILTELWGIWESTLEWCQAYRKHLLTENSVLLVCELNVPENKDWFTAVFTCRVSCALIFDSLKVNPSFQILLPPVSAIQLWTQKDHHYHMLRSLHYLLPLKLVEKPYWTYQTLPFAVAMVLSTVWCRPDPASTHPSFLWNHHIILEYLYHSQKALFSLAITI